MPVDMLRKHIYKISYDNLYKEFDSQQFFSDRNVQTMYLSRWFEMLKQADDNLVNDFMDKNIQKKIFQELQQAPEIFQTPIECKNATLYIHFRVSRIIEALKMCNISMIEPVEIDIEDFTLPNSYINWTETKDIVEIKQQPIIIVPFTIDEYYKLLVIDGNHRITDCINKKRKTIKAYCINEEFLIDNNLFISAFDKLLYIMMNEIEAIATYTMQENVPANILFMRTSLYTGKLLKVR